MTLKNNRVPVLNNIKLCASFHRQMWIQTGVTARKGLNGVTTSVTLTFDLWPFAWTLCLSMVITPENFRMIWWQEHCQKGATDGQTDRQTDGQTEISALRAAWSQLKMSAILYISIQNLMPTVMKFCKIYWSCQAVTHVFIHKYPYAWIIHLWWWNEIQCTRTFLGSTDISFKNLSCEANLSNNPWVLLYTMTSYMITIRERD